MYSTNKFFNIGRKIGRQHSRMCLVVWTNKTENIFQADTESKKSYVKDKQESQFL